MNGTDPVERVPSTTTDNDPNQAVNFDIGQVRKEASNPAAAATVVNGTPLNNQEMMQQLAAQQYAAQQQLMAPLMAQQML